MIPENTKDAIDRWVCKGTQPCSFVKALLENNLITVFLIGDANNLANLKDIVQYMYFYIPADCQGSVEKVKRWPSLLAERIARGSNYDHWNPDEKI